MFRTSEVDGVGWMYYTTCGYIGLDDDYSQVLMCRLEDSVDNMVHEVYRMGVIANAID